jgi:hypothetical protein
MVLRKAPCWTVSRLSAVLGILGHDGIGGAGLGAAAAGASQNQPLGSRMESFLIHDQLSCPSKAVTLLTAARFNLIIRNFVEFG